MPKLPLLSSKKSAPIDKRRIEVAVRYIDDYWTVLRRSTQQDSGTLIGLPHDYLVPAARSGDGFHFEEQYYWDSYFMVLGMDKPQYHALAEGMLDNLIHLYKRFGLIPNASRMYMTSRSQPPLLTSFIFHIYDTQKKSLAWLEERMETALSEYHTVWMNSEHPTWHKVYRNLSRYYDINLLHDLAEAESGWDMTPRFERKCLDFLPVDLNALLYKYEMDFARFAELKNDKKLAAVWKHHATERKKHMNELMWASMRGFFFDYNFEQHDQGNIWSLAAYYTMWTGMATKQQAKRLVDNLKRFEKKGGLSTTMKPLIDTSILFGSLKVQWANPNGWAPLQYIVVEGLRRYGYEKEAKRIVHAWMSGNLTWFEKHNEFLEKYNVVNPVKPPQSGVYPSQRGFGWTNGIFAYFAKQYYDVE
jgi:alpha,alpha-trehalase